MSDDKRVSNGPGATWGCGCLLMSAALSFAVGPIVMIIEAVGKHWIK